MELAPVNQAVIVFRVELQALIELNRGDVTISMA